MENAFLDSVGALNDHLEESGAALLYFYSDTCAPCIQLRPKVQELIESDFSNIELIMVDAQKHHELSAAFSAFSFPLLVLFFDGREFKRYSKYISVQELKADIGRLYRLYFGDQD